MWLLAYKRATHASLPFSASVLSKMLLVNIVFAGIISCVSGRKDYTQFPPDLFLGFNSLAYKIEGGWNADGEFYIFVVGM